MRLGISFSKLRYEDHASVFISAFGEHVIAKEVEQAMQEALIGTAIRINEFTVAPQITPKSGLPYHEWFIEFENEPNNIEDFALQIDNAMRQQNVSISPLNTSE